MALLFGRIRGRRALAWLKHRRWLEWNKVGPGPHDSRVTDDGTPRVTDLGAFRVVRPGGTSVVRIQEDGVTERFTEDGTLRLTEAA